MRRLAGAVTLLALAVAGATGMTSAGAVGPYPDLGSCSVFPLHRPAPPANAPSLPTEAAWNQDISKAPVAPSSAATIAYIDSHGGNLLHPDFGSPRSYGFPYAVVGAGQRKLPINYTAYGDESDPGPFPIPKGAPVEGGNGSDGDRHVLVVDRSSCTLYELYRAFFKGGGGAHWNADSGTRWDLQLERPPPRLLDLGRRRGAADLPRPRPLRRSRRRAGSSTRSGSPSTAPATPGSTPPRTAPATPPIPTRRRWGCGCGSRPATGSAASAAAPR